MLKDAEANKEADAKFRQSVTAEAYADVEIKEAENHMKQDYFTQAPDELKKEFSETLKELTEARKSKNVEVMVEKTEKLKNVLTSIGEAFSNAASAETVEDDAPAAEEAPEAVKPEAAVKDAADKKQKPPAPPKP